tara:strand:+ start:1115 stop:1360 length:246 start_codon:yes stop_codon:yes gene_type:complete
MDSGGEKTAKNPNEIGIKLNSIQVRLLPNLNVVLSLRYPAMGSETASHILDTLKMTPMTAGAIRSTSVENFMTYRLINKYI